jgi:hypothetical protein
VKLLGGSGFQVPDQYLDSSSRPWTGRCLSRLGVDSFDLLIVDRDLVLKADVSASQISKAVV